MSKNLITWIVLGVIIIFAVNFFNSRKQSDRSVQYSDFIQQVQTGQVASVEIQDKEIKGKFKNGNSFTTYNPGDIGLMGDLLANRVNVRSSPPEETSLLMQIFISWFPMLLLIAVWIFFARSMSGGGMGGGGNNPFTFGKSKAKMMTESDIKITFADVAGAEEAKEEVREFVDFLKNHNKYEKLGAKIPRGVLMVGVPGTGKTLLAKAIAGEAKVPFFSISGSDFVEMFVGVGASRVRDMFSKAKQHAPCIIFIDEIDAVGRSRNSSFGGGGNDEREQTLNQLLVEMDGFNGNEGIIVMAATNRPDVLDKALLRPGRFDRQIAIGLPDIKGREAILQVHLRKVSHNPSSVNLRDIARGTPGFSGADLANIINEAALIAARANAKKLTQMHLEKAKDKVIMGVERKTMVMSDDEKKLTAYHEAGHAIVGCLVPQHDPVYKVSIIPRGRALGVTMYLPEKDQWSLSKQKLESQLSSLYGGRIAEEMIFGLENVTTGASNDIERATKLARNMVTRWGLSNLGPLLYDDEEDNQNPFSQGQKSSDETNKKIDLAIKDFIDRNYQRAAKLLKDNEDKLHKMAEALIKYETIDEQQVNNIMSGKLVGKPKDWDEHDKSNATKSVEKTTKKTTTRKKTKTPSVEPKSLT